MNPCECCLAREGRNEGGCFATVWKRRLTIVARTTMIDQAHCVLRKHLTDDMDGHLADDMDKL